MKACYRVEYSKSALRAFKKLDRSMARLLLAWIEKNLEGCENPRVHGKALTANLAGLWRYRVGDYRLIADIQDDRLVILECVSKSQGMQFRADLAAFQGDFPQA